MAGAAATVALIGALRPAPSPSPDSAEANRGFQLSSEPVEAPPPEVELPPLEHPAPPGTVESSSTAAVTDGSLTEAERRYADEFIDAQDWVLLPAGAWRPTNPYRSTDFRSRWVNVERGARRSWTPPECSCTRLEVWVYGGSTTFGLNQRDERTIPSWLARAAWDAGIALDVSNRGALGHLHWLEAERFALDLTVEDPPDLVIFYDGANDVWASQTVNDRRTGDTDPPIDPTLVDVWESTGRSRAPVPDGPEGSSFIGRPDAEAFDQVEMVRVTMDRYDRARELSAATAARFDLPVRYVWQPSRYSRDFNPDEPHHDEDRENAARLNDQMQADLLATDVTDLTDVFDDTTAPLFTDDVHHNEEGSRIVGIALFRAFEADLRALLADAADP